MTTFHELESRIAADARFPRVACELAEGLLDFFACHAEARRLLSDQGQMRVVTVCIALDPAIRPAAVQSLVPLPIASPNRVAACLGLMRRQGALLPVSGAGAWPARLSPEFAALGRQWLRAVIAPSAALYDGDPPDFDDPGLYLGWCRQFIEATLHPTRALKVSSSLERAQSRRGGALLCLEVMRRALSEGAPSFSRKAFARRFGLSRSQVVELVHEAKAAGWVADAGGELAVSDAARTDGRAWLARFLTLGIATLEGTLQQRLAAGRHGP